MKEFVAEIIKIIREKHPDKQTLSNIKTKLAKKHKLKSIPTDIQIYLYASKEEIPEIKKYLITKPIRTIAGVSICAIMTEPYPCPHAIKGVGPCTMCPGGPGSVFGDVPMAYTGKEPATRRAIRNNYDPYLQVMNRLEQYTVQGHLPDKLEVIVMGGTFPATPKKYQEYFITNTFKAMNDFSRLFFKKHELDLERFKKYFELPGDIYNKERLVRVHEKLLKLKGDSKLEVEQKKNEKSDIRCVSLVIETRPDFGMIRQGNDLLRLGCTKIELGIQTIYDECLTAIKRDHDVAASIKSIKTLKDLGFKLNFHMMLGLPESSMEKDLKSLQSLFTMEEFQPDMLKLYPCMVLRGTELYKDWQVGKFKPMSTNEAAEVIAEFKRSVPEYCRIMRVQRDIPTYMTEAGVDKTNLRQYVEKIVNEKGIKCRCIRCREPKSHQISGKVELMVKSYKASDGSEFFISADDVKNDFILGFARLRFPSQSLRKEITKDSALIRELHVYGEAIQIGKEGRVQHKGIGKSLMKKAEEIAKENGKTKMVVISGIGAREYFRKLGYKKEGPYMVKKL